jgi:flagellin-like hook-associated protein FlgL
VNGGVTPPVTTYDIVDNVNNCRLLPGLRRRPGRTCARIRRAARSASPGRHRPTPTRRRSISARPSPSKARPPAVDTFTVRASVDQDVFATLHGLVTTLRNGTNGGGASSAAYQNALNAALSNIDNALDNVLTVRAQVGTRLKEVDVAQGTSEDLALVYQANLSRLQDLDYARALSDFSLKQTYFEAAQKSFLTITLSISSKLL